MDVRLTTSLINYFIREKFYGSALVKIDELLHQQSNADSNGYLVLAKAFCLSKLNKVADAIRLLKRMEVKYKDLRLATNCTLKVVYSNEATVDRQSLADVDAQIQRHTDGSVETDYCFAATMLMFEGQYDRARTFIMRSASSNSSAYYTIRGWIEVLSGRDLKSALELFEKAINMDNSIDAFLGKAKIYEIRHNAAEMKAILISFMQIHQSMLAGYIELARAAAFVRNWNEVIELAQNAALLQNDCIPAQLYELVNAIIVQGDVSAIEQSLMELHESVAAIESANVFVNLKICKLLTALTVDNPLLLQYNKRFLEHVISLNAKSSEILLQKARIHLDEKDARKALQAATSALELDTEHSPAPLLCVIRCNLELGNVAEATSQMEFLRATHKNVDQFPHYFSLRAELARAEGQMGSVSYFADLRQAVDLHFTCVQRHPYGLEYVERMDVAWLTGVAAELLNAAQFADTPPNDPMLKEAERILVFIYENCPGLPKPCYLLTKIKYLNKDMATAEALLRQCIKKNDDAEAYLLLAQIYVQKVDFEEALKLLEIGLSFDFKVRAHPLYYLIKAKLEKQAQHVDASVELLRTALDLPTGSSSSEGDRITIYLELIDSLRLLNKMEEADAVMKEAMKYFAGKAEQHQLVLMSAQLQLQRGNVNGALTTLQAIGANHPNYQAARIQMAHIYLTEKHDKQKFSLCYREILERDPSPKAYEMLGDAYMSIQEPTSAIEAYETAMRKSPKDHFLAEKIGNAYVKCHLYNKAITFYETAMKSGRQNVLRIRFAKQLFRMKNFDKCKRVLREGLDKEVDPFDLNALRDYVDYYMLLSQLHLEENEFDEAINDLCRARDLQLKIVSAMSSANRDNNGGAGETLSQTNDVKEERKIAAGICSQLAELYSSQRDWSRAIEYYKEAISYDEKDTRCRVSLATIYKSVGKLQLCNQQCQAILAVDPENSDASLLIADIMYHQSEGEEAMKHFAQILERNPNHYHALARYIELAWRRGNIDLMEKALKNAIENNPRASMDAGYSYCKGIVEWYTGEPNDALQIFNRARRDPEWGERALYNMIEICLNMDNDFIGNRLDADYDDEELQWKKIDDATEKDFGSKTADRFFKELRVKSGVDQKYKLVDNFISLCSPNKSNVQKALNNFLEMCRPDETELQLAGGKPRLNIGAILGSARAYIILKNSQKAKAQLKLTVGYPWTLDDADYLEQSWLLLSDLYMNQGKNEQATSLLRTVLQYNASCSRAYEYMAFLCERDQKYADAASNYEIAWKLCKNRNPAIGYKLAYNYLKCRRLFECIEVCHIVLKKYPSYPKIKRELLDKARLEIRT